MVVLIVDSGCFPRWLERVLSDFLPSQHHQYRPSRKARWLTVLVAAIGMPNIQVIAASDSFSDQSPATSITPKRMLRLHSGCYQQQKPIYRSPN